MKLHQYDTTFTFPLSPDRVALFRIQWPVEEKDLELIIATLVLWKRTLVHKPEPQVIPPTTDKPIEKELK